MNKFRCMAGWTALVALFLTLPVLAKPVLAQTKLAQKEWHEALKFGFDKRDWKMGWSKEEPNMYMFEFVVPGQTVENWKELVTYQFFPGLHITPKQMKQTFIADLRKTVPSVEVEDISSSPTDEIFEWGIEDVPAQNQFELDRIIAGKEGMHFLHYANKNINQEPAMKPVWLPILKRATVMP